MAEGPDTHKSTGVARPAEDADVDEQTHFKNILVVDDSPVERHLAVNLLAENLQCMVNQAVSGEEALLRIQLAPFDLLLTDLRMPDVDGLELLRRVKEEHPLLPVVVMTGQGTEETAVAALQGGADGYITKHRLAADVVGVVSSVLDAAERGRCRARLFRQLTRQSIEFELENNLSQIAPLWRMIVDNCSHLGIVTERDRVRMAVAIEEALMNAVVHGNLEVSSDLRERPGDEFEETIRQRQQTEPYASRRVNLKTELTQESARITITDSGPGFDVSVLPDPRDPQRIAISSGRGVLLMRSFMDEVIYNKSGNQVTLVKLRSKEPLLQTDSPHTNAELVTAPTGV